MLLLTLHKLQIILTIYNSDYKKIDNIILEKLEKN